MGTSSIMPCYDVERLETETHSGVNRVHQAQGEPWGPSVAWVSSESDTWRPYSYGETKQRGAWTMLVKWTPKRLLFKQKGLWPARRGYLGCKTLQMWTGRTSQPPHKCLKWTPRWTMPKTRRCLWWNGLWLRWVTATQRRNTLMC